MLPYKVTEESYKYDRCCNVLNAIEKGDAQAIDKLLPAVDEALHSEHSYS